MESVSYFTLKNINIGLILLSQKLTQYLLSQNFKNTKNLLRNFNKKPTMVKDYFRRVGFVIK